MVSIRKALALLMLSILIAAAQAYAVVTVESGFSGTLIITHPDGDVLLLEPGDPLPEIPQDAMVEVFDGNVTLHTEEGDQVQVGCFGEGHSVGGGSSAELTCGDTSGVLKVDGEEILISGAQAELADPTADSGETGVPSDQDPSPDSRSIQASTTT